MIPVSHDQFMEAVESAIDLVSQDIEVREDYSGRAMYGETCIAIVCDLPTFAVFCACLGSAADDWDWVSNARSDGMGLSTVYYWPEVKFEEVEHAS
jgi:hypothetical protein